jgi:hypothetical protein
MEERENLFFGLHGHAVPAYLLATLFDYSMCLMGRLIWD